LPEHRQPAQPASSSDVDAWQTLTGKAVGDVLGLDPLPTSEAAGCPGTAFAEYEDGIGFCYDPAQLGITDRLQADLLAWQIMGYQRSPMLIEYVQLEERRDDLRTELNTDEPDPDLLAQSATISERMDALAKQIGID